MDLQEFFFFFFWNSFAESLRIFQIYNLGIKRLTRIFLLFLQGERGRDS